LVLHCPSLAGNCLGVPFFLQRPELMAIEASIAHSTRKMNNARQLREQVSKEVEKQATKLRGYQTDLQTVQKAADEAQG
jgi:structural maintenance of chromosome 1